MVSAIPEDNGVSSPTNGLRHRPNGKGNASVNGINGSDLNSSETNSNSNSEPKPSEPKPSEPKPTESKPTESKPSEPKTSKPETTRKGVRFAPLFVPIARRKQTLAVFLHCSVLLIVVPIFFFVCAVPLAWPLLIPYILHVLFSRAATDGKLHWRSERFRRLRVWQWFGAYFPATLHKTADLPSERRYILGYHPHGIISHGAWAAFATEGLHFADKFPGITNSLLTLENNFHIPGYREYLLLAGMRSVSRSSIVHHLTRGGHDGQGAGRAVTIVIGGARESLQAHPGTMRLVLRGRYGFVKVAMTTGADLVPVMAFGESDLYEQVPSEAYPLLHRLQMWVLKVWKFTLPFLRGRGVFNYDYGLMPYRRPLHIVVGRPIPVTKAAADVPLDMAEVERLHSLYVAELQHLWETYKDEYAKDRIEEMQILP